MRRQFPWVVLAFVVVGALFCGPSALYAAASAPSLRPLELFPDPVSTALRNGAPRATEEPLPPCPNSNEIISFKPGPGTAQTSAWQSVGLPDGRGTPLGYLGQLTLRFPVAIANRAGYDLEVVEIGSSSPPAIDENFRVEASVDGFTWHLLGDRPGDVAYFDLGVAGLASAQYVRISDLPPREQTGSFDATVVGADIDAVVSLNCVSAEICGNGYDDDGDGLVDCDDADCRVDADHDGFAARPCGDDCDDLNPAVHPGAPEICTNGIDDDCNNDGDCNDVVCRGGDADGDGILNCVDACPWPDQRCQLFTLAPGEVERSAKQFDIVIAFDTDMPAGDWTTSLANEARSIRNALAQVPEFADKMDKLTFWTYTKGRIPSEWNSGSSDAILQLKTGLEQFGMEAVLIRAGRHPHGSFSSYTDVRDARMPVCFVYDAPNVAPLLVTCLHELGHGAFGLGDEYGVGFISTTECKNRVSPVRNHEPPPNVWATRDACAHDRDVFGYVTPCHEFCSSGVAQGVLRLGNSTQNQNLMRAAADAYGDYNVDGYGEASRRRIGDILQAYGPGATSPPRVAQSGNADRHRTPAYPCWACQRQSGFGGHRSR